MKICTRGPSSAALGVAALIAATALGAQDSARKALGALERGNARFAAGEPRTGALSPGDRRSLALGQSPKAIVLTCSDSRVAPEHLFDVGFGELYVVRVAGNVADPATVAAIEHAALDLHCRLLVVLGHEGCGAVGMATTGRTPSPAMARLLRRIEPAVRRAIALGVGGKELADTAETENVHQTVHDLLRQSELLQGLVGSERLRIARGRYDQDEGRVEWLPDLPVIGHAPAAPGTETVPTRALVPPHVALRMLQAGHRRYLSMGSPRGDTSAARRRQLAEEGEAPLAIVVTDSDSRVPPERIFDTGLGDIVTIRTPGPTLTPEVLASIEHAAAETGASLCVLLGHTGNGIVGRLAARTAHTDTPALSEFGARLRSVLERARASHPADEEELRHRATTLLLRDAISESRQRSTVLRQLEEQGELAFLGALYDVETGDIQWLPEVRPGTPHGEGIHADRAHAGAGGGRNPRGDHGHGASHRDEAEHGHGDAPARGKGGAGAADHGREDRGPDQDFTAFLELASAPEPHGHDGHGPGTHGHDTAGHDAHGHEVHGRDTHGHGGDGGHDHDAAAHGDQHGGSAAAKTDLFAVVLLLGVGFASAGAGVGVLLWLQRRKGADIEDAGAGDEDGDSDDPAARSA